MSGGSSKSSSSSATTNQFTSIDQRVVADGGSSVISTSGGLNLGDRSNFSIRTTTTDHGAIAAGRDVAISGLNAGRDISIAGLEASTIQQANALMAMSTAIANAQASAAGVAGAAIASSRASAADAMATVMDMGFNSTLFAAASMDEALGFAGAALEMQQEFQTQNQELIDQTQRGVEAAYKTANDMSSGQRVVVLAGLGVIGLVAVMMFAKGRKA